MAFTFNPYKKSADVSALEEKLKQYDQYKESQKVADAYKSYSDFGKTKPTDWNGGQYGQQLQDSLNDILNRKEFTYDLNGDMLYNQYRDRFIQQGKMAMQDTMGQAAALTGGYGNSYAQAAGQQAYQGYLQGLNDKVPELYQLALNKYNSDGDRMVQNYGLVKDMNDTEYKQYLDRVSQWNIDYDRLYNAYNNERTFDYGQFDSNRNYFGNQYNTALNFDYSKFNDDENKRYQMYQMANAGSGGSGGGSSGRSSGSSKSNGGSGGTPSQQQINATKSAIMTEEKFGKSAKPVTLGGRGNTGNGGYELSGHRYSDYSNYVDRQLADRYESGLLDEATYAYLLKQYGLV